jgi:hypothetical protein
MDDSPLSTSVDPREIDSTSESGIPKPTAPEVLYNCPSTGEPYVIVRSKDSGCHAGFLTNERGNTLVLRDSRRLWYWDGAASLSEMAQRGVTKPESCKFPCTLDELTVYGCCEKILATEKAYQSITSVPEWTATNPDS